MGRPSLQQRVAGNVHETDQERSKLERPSGEVQMTTFTEFQEYFIRLMWRTGDTEFANDLPRLVKKAEARINRDLRQIGMTSEYLGLLEGVDSFELPLDYVEARSLAIDGTNAVFRAITWQEMAARRSDGTTFSNTYA